MGDSSGYGQLLQEFASGEQSDQILSSAAQAKALAEKAHNMNIGEMVLGLGLPALEKTGAALAKRSKLVKRLMDNIDGVKSQVDDVQDGVARARGQLDDVRGQVDEATDAVRGQIDEASDTVRGQVDEATDAVRGQVDEATDAVRGQVDEATDAATGGLDEIDTARPTSLTELASTSGSDARTGFMSANDILSDADPESFMGEQLSSYANSQFAQQRASIAKASDEASLDTMADASELPPPGSTTELTNLASGGDEGSGGLLGDLGIDAAELGTEAGMVTVEEEAGTALDAVGLPEVGLVLNAVGAGTALYFGLKDIFGGSDDAPPPPTPALAHFEQGAISSIA